MGPDVFGNTNVSALNVSANDDGLSIGCKDSNRIEFAYLFGKNTNQNFTEVPADLFVQIDKNQVHKFSATLQNWNDHYGAVVFVSEFPDAKPLITEIGAARSIINIGLDVNGNRASVSVDATDSAKVAAALLSGCGANK